MVSSPSTCPFCKHVNPPRANFCNECGGPLHLKPCDQCEAVNERTAKHCHKCGAELSVPLTADEPSLASGIDETPVIATPSNDAGFAPKGLPESVAETLDVAGEPRGVSALREPAFLDARATTPRSLQQGLAQVGTLPKVVTAEPLRRKSRAAVYGFVVIVAAIGAYYFYSQAPRFKEFKTPQGPAGTAAEADSGSQRLPATPAKIGVLSASPLPGIGANDVAADASKANASGTDAVGNVTVSSDASVDLQAPRTERVNGDTTVPALDAGDARDEATTTSGVASPKARSETQPPARIGRAPALSRRATSPSPNATVPPVGQQRTADRRVETPAEVPRIAVCTNAVAALGFCKPNTPPESR